MSSRTFLQLCQQAHYEARVGGSGPSAVTAQTGRNADFVRWVLKAHEAIQLLHDDWTFDWDSDIFSMVANQEAYDPEADFAVTGGIRDMSREGVYAYDSTLGLSSRAWLTYMPWETFRYLTVPEVPGNMMTHFTLRPDGYVQYYPTPNSANLRAVHEFYRQPEVLAANTDVPRMPPQFHDAIVWRAVMLYADSLKDSFRYNTAKGEYDAIIDRMEMRCRPKIQIGGPLA
jgi:hypothetical protein